MAGSGVAAARVVVGVKRLADYLQRKAEADPHLRLVYVRGEVTNLSASPRGHCYFDLKEGDAILKCFAWGDDYARFRDLKNGSAVVATGSVSTYPLRSSYQLNVRMVEREGLGNVAALFEERKRKLAAEGLFAAERKRPLPLYPFRIALVSSRGANGALDFITILRERAPHVAVEWCETSVQGQSAAAEIVAALGRASRLDVDAIVVTRGGGSFEDLFSFSDENVVRAVARARHPVLSAIGHTADQQLCDFVADAHVETPSAAAKALGQGGLELRAAIAERLARGRAALDLRVERLQARLGKTLVRSRLGDPRAFLIPLEQRLDDAERRLGDSGRAAVRVREERLRGALRRLAAHDPSQRLAARAQRLQAAAMRLESAIAGRYGAELRRAREAGRRLEPAARMRLERARGGLEIANAHLNGKDPEAILQRGYAIVTYRNAIVRDPEAIPAGALIEARVARGTLAARVETEEADGNKHGG
jgi:exodeoxyribonuclease VII large subunit